jgi:hypothetical protein
MWAIDYQFTKSSLEEDPFGLGQGDIHPAIAGVGYTPQGAIRGK